LGALFCQSSAYPHPCLGLMIDSYTEFRTVSVYQLDLLLTSQVNDSSKISFGAEAVWCAEASQPDSFWSGFHIIDIGSEEVLVIDELTLKWHAD
ncbi:MAG: hypothetical protein KZQ81_18985, partial [Candidatus Thiodiazotropha sp. (ex Rostrolucina anterorostrata)]|nr:hypothetical protein [Candidatus Thiodiazotropha sp. (ex Rostrolucina anterorostrata)]